MVMAVVSGGDIRNAVADHKLEKRFRSLLSELTLRYAVFYSRRPSSQKSGYLCSLLAPAHIHTYDVIDNVDEFSSNNFC